VAGLRLEPTESDLVPPVHAPRSLLRFVTAACVAILAAAGVTDSHVVLDPERAQEIVRNVASYQGVVKTAGGRGQDMEALVMLGDAVDSLADTLNQDLVAHGQIGLVGETLVKQLNALGIGLSYSERERRYVYDLAAYREYLRRTPAGPRAADARFRLIARTFHGTLGPDPAALVNADLPALLRAIAAEEGFLRDHPGHEKAAEVRFFLAVDYYRAFRNAGDPARARPYGLRARQALERVTRSSNPFEARAAETLLEQTVDTLSQ